MRQLLLIAALAVGLTACGSDESPVYNEPVVSNDASGNWVVDLNNSDQVNQAYENIAGQDNVRCNPAEPRTDCQNVRPE